MKPSSSISLEVQAGTGVDQDMVSPVGAGEAHFCFASVAGQYAVMRFKVRELQNRLLLILIAVLAKVMGGFLGVGLGFQRVAIGIRSDFLQRVTLGLSRPCFHLAHLCFYFAQRIGARVLFRLGYGKLSAQLGERLEKLNLNVRDSTRLLRSSCDLYDIQYLLYASYGCRDAAHVDHGVFPSKEQDSTLEGSAA